MHERKTGRAMDTCMAVMLLALMSGLLFKADLVGWANRSHPLAAAFLQFSVLSTYGEVLSARLTSGSWRIAHLPAKMVLWGLIGMWISLAFPFAASGVEGLVAFGLWPDALRAFSISVWANLLSGYAVCMMLTQRWLNDVIDSGFYPPWHVFSQPGLADWGKVVLLSLVLFWLPAHTVTFMLPDAWRVLFAAFLGLALGIILGLRPQPRV